MDDATLAEAYERRLSQLEHVCHHLEQEARTSLDGHDGPSRLVFAVLSSEEFLEKVSRGSFDAPLVEVESQILGTLQVVDANSIRSTESTLREEFSVIESHWEIQHSGTRVLTCVIPPQVKPPGWDARDDVPKTFQIIVQENTALAQTLDYPSAVPFPVFRAESGKPEGDHANSSLESRPYDVFLAHNSADKDAVRRVGEQLESLGVRPWIDSEQIRPGQSFQDEIQAAIGQVRSVAVFLGKTGLGKWQLLEVKAALSRCVDSGIPVIPVLLPGVSSVPSSLPFLSEWHWVKFTKVDETAAVYRLAWGITGKKPSEIATSAGPLRPASDAIVESGGQPGRSSGVVFALHGIRTHAGWHRQLYELLSSEAWQVRTDRWVFGYYNVLQFLTPWSRRAKVKWFREAYNDEVKDRRVRLSEREYPSIVAHSFGTYILGNAMLKYDWLRFEKIILCGSILPQDFPWDKLIERGQVQVVRNEYGVQDIWVRLVSWFVADTDPSGRSGFSAAHERLVQERFDYEHSEYFDKGHMEAKWLPFLNEQFTAIVPRAVDVPRPKASRPLGLYAGYLALLAALAMVVHRVWG